MTTDGGPAFNIEHALNELCCLHQNIRLLLESGKYVKRDVVRSDLIQQRIVGEFAMLQERAKV